MKTGVTHQTPIWPQPHQPQWPIAQSHPRPMQLIPVKASGTLKRLFSHETDPSDDAPISIVIWFPCRSGHVQVSRQQRPPAVHFGSIRDDFSSSSPHTVPNSPAPNGRTPYSLPMAEKYRKKHLVNSRPDGALIDAKSCS